MTEKEYENIHFLLKEGKLSDLHDFLLSVSAPNDPNYWYYKGYTLRKLGKVDEAIESANKALFLDANFGLAHFELGMIYQSKGDYKKAIEHITKVVVSFSEQTMLSEKIDTLNSLALTYKMARDTDNAFKYYNLALETLAQEIYESIKGQPVKSIGFTHTGSPDRGWMRLAVQIAVKNTAKDGIENMLVPDGETAVKLLQQNPLVGIAIYDKDGSRYLLPAYFSAFIDALKQNLWYSTITNNIGMLYAETAEIRKAGDTFMEATDFIPLGSGYNAPILNFEELKRKYGDREYWK